MFLNIILIRKRCDRLVVGIKQNFVVSLHTKFPNYFTIRENVPWFIVISYIINRT